MNKVCNRCKEEKPLTSFHKDKRSKTGRRTICWSCDKARIRDPEKRKASMRKWNQDNVEKRRAYALMYNYGITLDQYNELLNRQNNRCGVCNKHESDFKTKLAVDHDHQTGEIFGLLCWQCNHKIIGEYRDPSIYEKAASFLTKGTGWFVPENKKKPKKRRKRKKKT